MINDEWFEIVIEYNHDNSVSILVFGLCFVNLREL